MLRLKLRHWKFSKIQNAGQSKSTKLHSSDYFWLVIRKWKKNRSEVILIVLELIIKHVYSECCPHRNAMDNSISWVWGGMYDFVDKAEVTLFLSVLRKNGKIQVTTKICLNCFDRFWSDEDEKISKLFCQKDRLRVADGTSLRLYPLDFSIEGFWLKIQTRGSVTPWKIFGNKEFETDWKKFASIL